MAAVATAGVLVAAVASAWGCAGRVDAATASDSRVAMEVNAARRGAGRIEISIRLNDAEGEVIAAPRVVARVGEPARVVIGGEVAAGVVSGTATGPRVEIEIDSWTSSSVGGGIVEVTVAATIVFANGRIERPVAALSVGVGPPARIVVG